MSHFTRIKTQMREWEILKAAVEAMGMRCEEGAQIELVSDAGERIHVCRIIETGRPAGRIGVYETDDGEFEFCADWFEVKRSCNLSQQLFMKRLRQHYSRIQVLRQARELGLMVEVEEQCENGEIRIVLAEPL